MIWLTAQDFRDIRLTACSYAVSDLKSRRSAVLRGNIPQELPCRRPAACLAIPKKFQAGDACCRGQCPLRQSAIRQSVNRLISRQCRRAEVFIKARWVALVHPVGLLLALTEALRAPQLAQGFD